MLVVVNCLGVIKGTAHKKRTQYVNLYYNRYFKMLIKSMKRIIPRGFQYQF